MVVHEVVRDQNFKELCAVNGGSAGGNQVKTKFEDLMKDIIGSDFIGLYKKHKSQQRLALMIR